jgi:hypothetical protein
VFGDNAVLSSSTAWQGGVTPARVFGGGVKGEAITITGLPAGAVVAPSNPFTVPSDGSWSVTIASPDSPDFFNITFTGSAKQNAVTLRSVRFGLTWLCGGQSNMNMILDNCFYANETVAASSSYSDIVFKTGPGVGPWTVMGSNERSLRDFSGLCIFTALHLKQNVPAMKDVPIGLIHSSVGGTTIESWMSADALAASGVISEPQCGYTKGCGSQAYCGNYLPLILPLAPFTFKSFTWMQGESNVACNAPTGDTPGYYASLLPALVRSWRALFQTNFSAFVVMLAPQGRTDETSAARSADAYPYLREAQLSALALPGAALVYPIDMGDDGKTVYTPPSARHGDVHPRNKTEFGRRVALAYAQGEGLLPAGVAGGGPAFAGAALAPDGGSVLLSFAAGLAGAGLRLAPTADCYTFGRAGPAGASGADCCQMNATDPSSPHGFPFELEAGGAWTLAQATVEAGGLQVRLAPAVCGNGACPGVGKPLSGRVRYAWDEWPLCVLANAQGLPLPPFVTR